MNKKIVVFITFIALTVLAFLERPDFFGWIQTTYKTISITGTIIVGLNIAWNKWLWYFPAKWNWKFIIDLPIIKGEYDVIIGSLDGNKTKYYEAKVRIKQEAKKIEINLYSETGISESTTVGVIKNETGYLIEYFYYLKPLKGKHVKSNPAHDGSSKILVVDNKIVNWEYWTNRNTKGSISLKSIE